MADGQTAVRHERNSTIELLRILCMLAVIAHHCVVHGGAMGMEPCVNKYIASLILPLGKISFTCFVAISMWFLVDQQFKAARFIRTWLEVLFYSFLMMYPSIAFGEQPTINDWLGSLLPIGGNSHGFAATYLAFYLLLPLLNKATKGITKSQTLWCLCVLGYVQIVEPVLAQVGLANLLLHPFVSELTLFCCCYFAAVYLKRWAPVFTRNAVAMGLVVILVWVFVFVLTVQGWRVGGNWLVVASIFAAGENSVLYLLGGFSLFLCFNSVQPFCSKLVNLLASTTFGVLLIHDHGFFRNVLWNQIVSVPSWWYEPSFLVRVIIWTLFIFSICMIVDLIRQRMVEKRIIKSKGIHRIIELMDMIWKY